MKNPIVQCVPNISEGKDIKKIEYITEPLKHQVGFKLISVEPDKDYHRSVITLIGNPEDMIEPLIKFFMRAQETIDMRKHQGEHSRMGAVDVCPFIPILDITIEECVSYAKLLAEKVAQELNVSVFLYAKAAQNEDRINLPDIRKGEFEAMNDKMKDPKWMPDFGPTEMHPSFGVVAIGARIPLVAYNIDLSTTDEKIARSIARAIRQSSGGFQYIQAGPVFLEERGHAQVTMNILDFKKNPIYRIFETVQMEAKRYQVDVTGSEVVGLIPKEALCDSVKYYRLANKESFNKDMEISELIVQSKKYLKLRDFDELKIIEANL
ncbi:MAG: glutamate formimidoyltransferase [Acholeplasmataceae bacterium]|nr:glutamate formimidoyltransferase [Acholeplasmataceae bacterium]